jgi:ankyrin repeat protein
MHLNDNAEMVILLLEQRNLNINLKDNEGQTSLTYAALKNNLDQLILILERTNIEVNSMDIYNWTPLSYAASYSSLEIIKLLVEHNADVNRLILSCAAGRSDGTSEPLKFLWGYNSNGTHLKDCSGRNTPISSAAASGNTEVLRFLLKDRSSDFEVDSRIIWIELHSHTLWQEDTWKQQSYCCSEWVLKWIQRITRGELHSHTLRKGPTWNQSNYYCSKWVLMYAPQI